VGGGKGAIQYDIKSAIVTSQPLPFKAVSMQAGTAQRIAEQRPDWDDSIEAQIARNNMLNQDKKLGAELYVAPKEQVATTTVPIVESTQQPTNIVSNSVNLEQFMNSNPQQPVVQFS
jgi:hypothetical protein